MSETAVASSYKIEKGITIPSREIPYPFKDMEVGDSFLVSDKDKTSGARAAMTTYNKANKEANIEIISRKEGEGLRFWRTK